MGEEPHTSQLTATRAWETRANRLWASIETSRDVCIYLFCQSRGPTEGLLLTRGHQETEGHSARTLVHKISERASEQTSQDLRKPLPRIINAGINSPRARRRSSSE